jgi:chemosensory pili system protein ChpA (sensor histidine kinase/response regulator)
MHTPSDVLIVDDDLDLTKSVQRVLEAAGYTVRSARTGREALAAVAQKMPSVILLDMLMPDMDGWDCAMELRARYGRGVPVVIVTAAARARERAEQLGIDHVLGKPFDLEDLFAVLSRFHSRRKPDVPAR